MNKRSVCKKKNQNLMATLCKTYFVCGSNYLSRNCICKLIFKSFVSANSFSYKYIYLIFNLKSDYITLISIPRFTLSIARKKSK